MTHAHVNIRLSASSDELLPPFLLPEKDKEGGRDSPATELGRGMRYRGMEWAEWEDMLSRLRSGILLRLQVEAVMFSSTLYRNESMPDFWDCHSFRFPREPSPYFPPRSMFSEQLVSVAAAETKQHCLHLGHVSFRRAELCLSDAERTFRPE